MDLKKENELLREELVTRGKEFSELKQNLSMQMQVASAKGISISGKQTSAGSVPFQSILETQSQELVRSRRLLEEY